MYTNNITFDVNSILLTHEENNTNTENTENIPDYYVKKYTFNNNEYKIIKYNKEKLNLYKQNEDYENYNRLGKFRSVIIRDKKVVSYSPGKSLNYNSFKLQNTDSSDCWVEDFIDGTMINVFYDNINETWEIATKSTVGGNIIFFNNIKNYKNFAPESENSKYYENHYNATFRTLFFEACNSNNFNLNTLNRLYCYSFVMQHPYNRIVTPSSMPLIYLVKVYEIDNTNFTCSINIKELNLQSFISSPPYIFLNTNVKFVNKYPFLSFEALEEYYNSDNIPFHCVGCMIYSSNGSRSKIRNSNYEMVRKLRGNQPKLQYNYLCLKKEGKVKDFLYYYPEHKLIFNKFKLLMHNYTNELFINYISCFIRKEKPLKEYDFQYKNHMYKLHESYKSVLKQTNQKIDKKFVIEYVNALHPAQQMFVINYKNKIEFEKNKMQTLDDNNVNNNMEDLVMQ